VNVERGFYKCLACGARGDVLNLYQALHGLPDIQTTINQVARGLVG
jgi:DNA primase